MNPDEVNRANLFKKQNDTFEDIVTNCYLNIDEINTIIYNYQKMIIQGAPYEKITDQEKLLRDKLNNFSVRNYDESSEQKYIFRDFDSRLYNLSNSQLIFINEYCSLVYIFYIDVANLIHKINTGAPYEILNEDMVNKENIVDKIRNLKNKIN